MTRQPLPETIIDPILKQGVDGVAATFASIADAEIDACTKDIVATLRESQRWIEFCDLVTATIRQHGYIVVRGLKADEGRTLLIVSSAIGSAFATYGTGRIVKRFRMSPWTNELSHTTRAGDFHTDGNVSTFPPFYTTMQCEQEDPGAPEFAEQRVAHLPHVLERLALGNSEDIQALKFLTEFDTAMAHERSSNLWRGRLVQNGEIRYHPHSLRLASKRLGEQSPKLESAIAAIHRVALETSVPFHTRQGDTVMVSNRTALHYRGACSVRFTKFPTEFDSRSLFVLHLKDPSE
jgi:hypothetical protein